MRVWVLQGQAGEDPGGVLPLVGRLNGEPADEPWEWDVRCPGPGLLADLNSQRPEVLVLPEELDPGGGVLEEWLAVGVGLVVTTRQHAKRFCSLAEVYPVCLVPPAPGTDSLRLAVLGAHAGRCRQRHWQAQVEQLQQRLHDRIVIERAKGVLVQRLGISEEEAYKRLRMLSRRQRRQIRDIAQSLLDTQSLLVPGGNGLDESAREVPLAEPGRPPGDP